MFVFWGAAKGFGHYFCFAKEDASERKMCVSPYQSRVAEGVL